MLSHRTVVDCMDLLRQFERKFDRCVWIFACFLKYLNVPILSIVMVTSLLVSAI